MTDAPERIWLQDDGDYSKARMAFHDLTWCEDRVNDADTEYRRADLPLPDEEIVKHPKVKALVDALEKIRDMKPHHAGQTANEYHMQVIATTALRDLKGGEG